MTPTRRNSFVTGSELGSLFSILSPFDTDFNVKPEETRQTILAANVNFPFELQVAAFLEAASLDGGSPIIMQASGAALSLAGRATRASKDELPTKAERLTALELGAKLFLCAGEVYMEAFNPPFVALGLDHFPVPDLRQVLFSPGVSPGKGARDGLNDQAKRRLTEATDAALAWGVSKPSAEDVAAWETYLVSDQYREAVESFLLLVKVLAPAWAMIDTEDLPPVLNFAITKEICDAASSISPDVLVEAEYGATGQSGDRIGYQKLEGADLDKFAKQVAGFIKYTGARGVSYPIGMEHAALGAERHEPDVTRLETTQREIMKTTGFYVPFAQHGGTGAKRIIKGLVGKNNVNTHFLVAGAQCLSAFVSRNQSDIELGRKSACGPVMYISAGRAILNAATAKMKDCGSYGKFPELRGHLTR